MVFFGSGCSKCSCRNGFRESERASRAHPRQISGRGYEIPSPDTSSCRPAGLQRFSLLLSIFQITRSRRSGAGPSADGAAPGPPGGSAGSPGRSCGGSLRPRSGLVPSYQPCPMVIPKRVHSIPFLTINLTRSLQVCYIAIISQEFSRYAGGAGISAGPADPWRL